MRAIGILLILFAAHFVGDFVLQAWQVWPSGVRC